MRVVMVVHRARGGGFQVAHQRLAGGPGARIGQLGAARRARRRPHPADVPAGLRVAGVAGVAGAAAEAAHPALLRHRVPDLARRAAVVGQRVAHHRVAGAEGGDVAPVGAGAKTVERVAHLAVLRSDAVVAIPVDGLRIDADVGAGRPPVRKIAVVAGRATGAAAVDPQRIIGRAGLAPHCTGKQQTRRYQQTHRFTHIVLPAENWMNRD